MLFWVLVVLPSCYDPSEGLRALSSLCLSLHKLKKSKVFFLLNYHLTKILNYGSN